ncbi:MAG: hydantoinase/oxoprolinase family protein [Lachnospiraceae bacterium]|nr:hydantoinase/oxoprolinase family protein [Lachnospiraceae bacterium]
MSIGLGIDTGGTYTDAVIYDMDAGEVLESGKSLTTKYDLTVGIKNVLDKLSPNLLSKVSMVGLSTTMATNACVENKAGRAKLIMWGISPDTVERFGSKYGLPKAEDIYFQESYPIFTGGYEKEVDWKTFEDKIEEEFSHCDAVATVELFAMNNNAKVEKKAKQLIREKLGIPVICGNELFSDIDTLQRGSSVLLNAGLIPTIDEFTKAIKTVLKEKNISVPVGIVRSDGSLMSERFAMEYPVETILCGPAASVIGGAGLTDEKNSIVIDMGGTTTDMAIIKDGVPVTVEDGIKIGKWKTFVKGLYVDTFGLGGDSAIRHNNGRLVIDTARVIPICILASRYPYVLDELKKLEKEEFPHTRYIHEFLVYVKDIENNDNYNEDEKKLCRRLKEGPMSLTQAAEYMDSDVYHFKADRLEREGVIIRSGLTPTDIMHLKGDFSEYDTKSIEMVVDYYKVCLDSKPDRETLCNMIYKEVMKKLYINIVRCVLEYSSPYYRKNGLDLGTLNLISDDFERKFNAKDDEIMECNFKVNFSLIGIGAPIHIFLPEVGRLLGTKTVIPKYSSVANAIGAINGNIIAKERVEIKPTIGGGFDVYGKEEKKHFDFVEPAKEYAVEDLKKYTKAQAKERGADGDITFSVDIKDEKSLAKHDMRVYTGSIVTVAAIGKIKLTD